MDQVKVVLQSSLMLHVRSSEDKLNYNEQRYAVGAIVLEHYAFNLQFVQYVLIRIKYI